MRRTRRRAASESTPPAKADDDGIQVFRDQARWLLEWHNKRNDGIITRSVALLGFTGVILALLPRGLDLNGGIQATGGIRACVIVTAVLLLATAAFCLAAVAPRRSNAPNVTKLRERWRDYANGTDRRTPLGQVTEEFLHGKSAEATSPLNLASKEASSRAFWFTMAIFSLGLALLALAGLVVQIFWQL